MAAPFQPNKRQAGEDAAPSPKKRQRAARACIVCRRKRIKCSGTMPCTHCLGYDHECEYGDSKRGKTSTTSSAAKSKDQSYVKALEERMSRMEDLLRTSATSTSPRTSLSALPPLPFPTSSGCQQQISVLPASRRSSLGSSVDGGVVDAAPGSAQLKADSTGQLRFIGNASIVSIVNELGDRFDEGENDRRPSGRPVSVDMPFLTNSLGLDISAALPRSERVQWPPEDLAERLIDAFFDKIDPICPLLHKPAFLRDYGELRRNPRSAISSVLPSIFAVFACAAPLVDDPRVRQAGGFGDKEDFIIRNSVDGAQETVSKRYAGVRYYGQAVLLSYSLMPIMRLAHVQTLALFASNCLARAWVLIGHAMRAAQDLGLHRSLATLKITALETELRKRVFWTVYSLDRTLSAALGRPLGIRDEDIDADLPLEIDSATLERLAQGHSPVSAQLRTCTITGSNSLVFCHRIVGQASQTATTSARRVAAHGDTTAIEREVAANAAALDDWLGDVPAHLRDDRDNCSTAFTIQRAVTCSSYWIASLLIHRPMLPCRDEEPSQANLDALARCAAASKALAQSVNAVADSIPPSPYLLDFVQSLLVAGGILLLCQRLAVITDSDRASQAGVQLQRHIEECVAGLRRLEAVFPAAAKYRDILQDLIARSSSSSRSSAKAALGISTHMAGPSRDSITIPLPVPSFDSLAPPLDGSPIEDPNPLAFFGDLAYGDFTSAPDWFAGLDALASFASAPGQAIATATDESNVFEMYLASQEATLSTAGANWLDSADGQHSSFEHHGQA